MNYWIIQGIGFLALVIALLVFQVNKRKKMLNLKMVSALLYSLHFLLLGAFTGSVMELVGAFRSYIFSKRDEEKWVRTNFWLYFFIVVFLVAGLSTWQSFYSILPVMGMIAGTVAFWLKNPKLIRIVSLIAPPLWLIYSYVVGSIPGMANELLMLSTVIVGIVRFDLIKAKKLSKELVKK